VVACSLLLNASGFVKPCSELKTGLKKQTSVETIAMRGPAEEKAIMQLARSADVAVLASAGSTQSATAVIDLLNEKHGRQTVRFGMPIKREATWKMNRNFLSPAYTTNFSQILCVND
jgi:hypothetical protein